MEFDFEEIKENLIDLFYKNKKRILIAGSCVFGLALIFCLFLKNDYDKRIASSNLLVDYINGENDEFMKRDHKMGYGLLKKVIEARDNPSVEKFDEFSKMDDYVFKSLFYFAKCLYFNYQDEYYSYYESDKNPWSNLIITAGVFNGSRSISLIKKKEEYLMIFAIGKGLQC